MAEFIEQRIPGVILVKPQVHGDARGFFVERYRADTYAANGIDRSFVQTNQSFSRKGVLRGLHYQLRRPQAKLVSVICGRIFDVAVDLRIGSPHFGQWTGAILTAEGAEQLFIPEGFAHGFYVLSDSAHFIYQCSDFYAPGDEYGVRFDSGAVNVDWFGASGADADAIAHAIASDRDKALPDLTDVPPGNLPVYRK